VESTEVSSGDAVRIHEETNVSRSALLRISAVLSLITCVGHTIGTFMPVPAEQTQMHATIATMKATLVPMPVGSARSYMEILDGNNICTSLLLLFCAAVLFAVSRAAREPVINRVVTLTALALAAVSALSFRYFFPVPGLFTGLGALLALLALGRPSSPGLRT
jgi:hypothetical protein